MSSISATSLEAANKKYEGEPRRWWILFVVTLGQTMGTLIFSTMNPLAIEIARAFQLKSVMVVNLSIIINMVNGVPFTFLSIYLFGKYNVSSVLRFISTLMLIGTLMRATVFKIDSFWPVIIGSYICSCANPFFINCQAIIANIWFTDKERAVATALQTLAMPMGSAFTFALNQYWFANPEADFKALFKTLMLT